MEQRLIDLETKSAYQEHLIQELNEVVIAQQQQMDDLAKMVQQVKAYVRNMEDSPSETAVESPPPHY